MAIQVGSSGTTGIRGVAQVNVMPNGKIRVVFADESVYDVLAEDAPKWIVSGKQQVKLGSDGTRIYYCAPERGTVKTRFLHFNKKETDPAPAPYAVQGKSGISREGKPFAIEPHLEFSFALEILEGKYQGYQITGNLWYAFVPYTDELGISGKGSKKLAEFLQAFGVDFEKDTLPLSENILPFLEAMLKERAVQVYVSLKDGYVNSYSPEVD